MKFKPQQIKAAKSRVKDTSLKSSSSISDLALSYLSKIKESETPRLLLQETGSILDSFKESEYLKDIKFQIHLQNLKCIKVNKEVLKASKSNFANINKIKQELSSLSSEIKEEELRAIQNFTKVHFNNFQRMIDSNLGWNDKRCLKDYKTGFSFLENQMMVNQKGLGLTLPVKEMVKIPSPRIRIVHEETDSGDTIKPLKASDPQNLDRENKTFFYVIAKKTQDKSSRLYKEVVDQGVGAPRLTIELEFSTVVQINYIDLEPISNSKLFIFENSISYKDGNGNQRTVDNAQVVESGNLKILFEPIRASSIKLSLSAPSVSGRKILNNNGALERALNKLLSESPMSARLLPEGELLASNVFDFSLKQASAGLCAFYPKGIFRAKNEVKVNSPLGFSMTYQARETRESFGFEINSKSNPIDETVYETYVHAKIYGGQVGSADTPITMSKPTESSFNQSPGTLVLDATIPMLDSGLLQHEYMEFVENRSKVKLFPDTRYGLDRVGIKSIAPVQDSSNFLYQNKVYDINNIADHYETLSAIVYESSTQEVVDFSLALNVVSGNITTDVLLEEFSENNAKHLKAKKEIEDALLQLTAKQRGNAAPVLFNYLAPNDDDLNYLLGNAWSEAGEDKKADIRSNPELYLLLSEGTISSKPLNDSDGVVFCKSCVLESGPAFNWLGNSLYTTKLVCLTGALENLTYDNNDNSYSISCQIEVVRDELRLTEGVRWFGVNPTIALSLEEKYTLHRYSRINNAANRLKQEVLASPALDSNTYRNLVTLYQYAIYNGAIAIKKENMQRADTLGLSARVTDHYWCQEFGKTGTNSYKLASFVSKTSEAERDKMSLSTFKKACGIHESVSINKEGIVNSAEYKELTAHGTGSSSVLQIETLSDHKLTTGDEFAIVSHPSSVGGVHVVSAVISPNIFQIKRLNGAVHSLLGLKQNADPEEKIDLSFENISCLNKSFTENSINVFSNGMLLKLGVDYYLSMNKGSDWFATIPVDSTYEDFLAKSTAGEFYIMVKPGVGDGAFSIKYNVKRNQYLEPSRLIYLKNGRITCSSKLRGSSGTLRALIVSRTRSLHPYITPILENYKLCVQEHPSAIDNSGKVFSNEMLYTDRKKTTDVS